MNLVNFNVEQKEIVCTIEQLSKTEKGKRFIWNKFNGNMACNVVKYYLKKHLKSDLKVVGPAFIEGSPLEFDLLIVDKKSKPKEFTDSYSGDSVHILIEVKSHGVFSEKALKKIKETFDDLTKHYSKKCLYLALRESGKPKRKGSKNFIQITKNALAPYDVFILCDSRTKELYVNQWEEFIRTINCARKIYCKRK